MRSISKIVAVACMGLLLFPPHVLAAGVTPDPNAGNKRPSVDAAPNGVPVVNITGAGPGGLSHNQYHDFNVGKPGLILNNGSQASQTQLGGIIGGNPNFGGNAGREASTILNEVTSANRSYIEGYLEVGGRRADVILANPNGVTINGGGFINVPRATVTTGVPDVKNGVLQGVDVRQGTVRIEGAGINAANTDAFSILSQTAEVAAQVYANDLTIIAGQNRVDASGTVTPLPASQKADPADPAKPVVGVDSSLLGGMYAGRITIMATEKGVGVNLEGTVQSAHQMRITSDGKLVLREAASGGDIALASNAEVTVTQSAAAGANINVSATGSTGAVNVQGTLAAGQNASLGADTVNVAGGTVAAGQDVTLTAREVNVERGTVAAGLDSAGTVTLPGKIKVKADTAKITKSTLLAGADLSMEAAQATLDTSTLVAGADLHLQTSLALLDTSTLAAGGRLQLRGGRVEASAATLQGGAVSSDLTSLHLKDKSRLEALGGMELLGGTAQAVDSAFSAGTGLLVRLDSLSLGKDATLSAGEDLALNVATLDLDGAFVAAGRDLGYSGNTLSAKSSVLYAARDQFLLADTLLYNELGDIYAGRNITIGTTTGQRTNAVRNLSGTIAAAGGSLSIFADTLENARLKLDIARDATQISSSSYTETTYWGSGDTRNWEDHFIRVMQDVVREATVAGVITAALDMALDANSITNAYSSIAAGGNIAFRAENYTAISTNANQVRYEDIHYNHDDSDGDYYDWGWAHNSNVEAVLERFDATMVANGTLSAEVSGTLEQLGKQQQGALPGEAGRPGDFPLASSPMFRPVSTPGHHYLIETNPLLTNMGYFYGSKYFFDRLGLDLETEQRKLLGDSFFETRLVQDQILQSTGQRFLKGYSTDADQMRGLMDAAYAQADGLGLALGVELTRDQVAALTQDMIWLVEEEYQGQKVLVPRLYLAAASQQDVLSGGSTMAGREVNITAGKINNDGGVLYGKQTLTAVADQIRNAGGGLMAGDTVQLASRGDITNTGATISGKDVTLVAQGNITSESEVVQWKTSSTNIARSSLGNEGAVNADTLKMQAGSDITLKGSAVNTTGDAMLTAGNNINVQTVVTGHSLDYGKYKDSASTNTGSQISVGGNLNITAANDLTVAGSNMLVKGDAALTAGNNLTVAAVTDSMHKEARSSSARGSESMNVTNTTSVGSTINAEGKLTLTAGADPLKTAAVAVIGSQLGSASTLTLQASGDVIVASSQNTSFSSFSKSSSSLLSSSSKKWGESSVTQMGSLLVGKDVVLDAGKGVGVSSSAILGSNNVTLVARDGDVKIAGADNMNSSWYQSKSTKVGLSFATGEGSFSINRLTGKEKKYEGAESYMAGSTITAGNDLVIVAKRDITSMGSELGAGQDALLNAGRDVNLTPGLSTSYEQFSKKTFTEGFTFTLTEDLDRAGIFVGLTSVEKGHNKHTTEDKGSTLHAGRDVLVKAGSDINVVGSTVQAGQDMALSAGGSINVLEGRATEDIKEWQKQVQAGLILEVTQNVTTSLKSMNQYLVDLNDTWGNLKTTDEKITEGGKALATAAQLGAVLNPTATIKLGASVSGSYSEAWQHSSSAIGSSLGAGRDMVLDADKDIWIRGSQLLANGNISIAGDNVTVESAQNYAEKGSWGQKYSTFVGVKAGASFSNGYEPPVGINFTGGYGESRANSDSRTQTNSVLNAGGLLGIESKKDTSISGAKLQGYDVAMNVGRDLNLSSRKDTSESSSFAAEGEVSVTVTYGDAGASVRGSVSSSEAQSRLVKEQTSIIGINSVDIRTEKNTDIRGAAIVALNDKLKLDTGTLSYGNMDGKASSFGFGFGGGIGYDATGTTSRETGWVAWDGEWRPTIGGLSLSIYNQDQVARATVGKGEIITRDNPSQSLDGLNRDPQAALKLKDRTGFSVSIESPQKIYQDITGGLGVVGAWNAWKPWLSSPEEIEMQSLRKGLEKIEIPKERLEAAKTPADLMAIYVEKKVDMPEDALTIQKFNNMYYKSDKKEFYQWQFTRYKAKDAYDNRWINIPIVDKIYK